MTEDTEQEKRRFIRCRLKEDLMASDLQVSLLLTAQGNYRYDTVLRPFPPMYNGATPEERDYKTLAKVTSKLGRLTGIDDRIIDTQVLELLYWILSPKNFTLNSCKKDKFEVIKTLTGQVLPTSAPSHIFEVVPTEVADERFQVKRGGRDTFYAYHGSRVENFHSILNYGLQSHLNKNGLFGEGTYLSSEMGVSMPYAPSGQSWKHSVIGDRLSLIAVCEIINDHSVKCQVKDAENKPVSRRSRVSSSACEVPEKYFVVQNNDMIRVKYIVVFAESSKPRSGRPSWVYQHRFFLVLLVYGLLLGFIGLYNSRTVRYYLKRWAR